MATVEGKQPIANGPYDQDESDMEDQKDDNGKEYEDDTDKWNDICSRDEDDLEDE